MHLLINYSLFVLFSVYTTSESQEVILDQLLHVQYPIDRILSHFDTLSKVSKIIDPETAEIFFAISYCLHKLRCFTKIGDEPKESLVISTLDGKLK